MNFNNSYVILYNKVKQWVLSQSKLVDSFSPNIVFKKIHGNKIDIVNCLDLLCDEKILERQFYYTCECGDDYIVGSLCDLPELCEACGKVIDNPIKSAFLEYKIIRKEGSINEGYKKD